MNHQFSGISIVASMAFMSLIGCGGDPGNPNRPRVVEVSGKVTYKQQPVEGASVLFTPIASGTANQTPETAGAPASMGFGATGLTDAQGNFKLRTFDPGDGAVPGTYTVSIFKYDMSTANPELEDDLALENRKDTDQLVGPTPLLPVRYAEAATSDLVEEVSATSPNEFTFDLVD